MRANASGRPSARENSASALPLPSQPAAAGPGRVDDLAPPDDGFQLRSQGAEIAAGEDIEYCEIAELPGDPSQTYYVSSLELANAAYSHHLVVAAALPETDADRTLRGLNVGDRVQCNGATFEWPQTGLVPFGTTQTPYLELSFPEGVGTVLHGQQRIVFDYHYLNSSDQPVRAQSALNVHVVESGALQHIAIPFSFFNFTIDIPAHSQRSFTSVCHFHDDLIVSSLVRHTHQQGRDFSVWFSGGPDDGQHLWTSEDWKHDIEYRFAEPRRMKAGEGFRFECAFENSMDRRLRYGIGGSDEMCILGGWIWPDGDARELPAQDCGIAWIDEQGVGHPVTEGDFPAAAPRDAATCQTGLRFMGVPEGLDPSCGDCACNSCGSILLECAQDPDCQAIVQCLGGGGCSDASGCIQACERVLHDHSSAIGLIQQVQSCLGTQCRHCNPLAP